MSPNLILGFGDKNTNVYFENRSYQFDSLPPEKKRLSYSCIVSSLVNLPFSPKQQKLPLDSSHPNIVRTRVLGPKLRQKVRNIDGRIRYFLIVSRLFCHPCIREKEQNLTKNGRKWLSWDMEVLACFRPILLKKMVWESLKNTRALMVERNYGSNYKGFFLFSRWAE